MLATLQIISRSSFWAYMKRINEYIKILTSLIFSDYEIWRYFAIPSIFDFCYFDDENNAFL